MKTVLVTRFPLVLSVLLFLAGFLSLESYQTQGAGVSANPTYVGGGLYENTTWSEGGSPYVITQGIVLFPGYTLTIEPGVEVRSRYPGLEIRGTLISEGTASKPIVFTSESLNPTRGAWGGIRIRSDLGGSASIKFARISYAYKAISIEADYLSSTPPLGGPVNVHDSIFTDNEVGLMGNSPALTTIERSVFRNNDTGAWGDGNKVFCNSVFINNDFGITMGNELSKVYTSVFRENRVGMVGGGDIQYSEFTGNDKALFGGVISNSTVFNNRAGIEAGYLGRNNSIFSNFVYRPDEFVYSWNYKMGGSRNAHFPNNWWGTTDTKIIDAGIYDGYDDPSLGIVNYQPIFNEPPVLVPPAFCPGPLPSLLPMPTPTPTPTFTRTPTPATPLPPTPTPVQGERIKLVTELYRSLLCRQPDPPGLEHWANSSLTLGELGEAFINSPEGQRVAAVRALYTSILARDPMPTDCGGLRSWVNSDLSLAQVQASLEASGEGQRVAAVRGLYIELLGRDPLGSDNAGLRYWVQLPLPISEIRRLIMESEEYRRRLGR